MNQLQGAVVAPECFEDKSLSAVETKILSITHKAGLAVNHRGDPDFIYALALEAISSIVGPDALHDVESLKTKSMYDWSIKLLMEKIDGARKERDNSGRSF